MKRLIDKLVHNQLVKGRDGCVERQTKNFRWSASVFGELIKICRNKF